MSRIILALVLLGMPVAAMAQSNGNEANGRDYQPTPSQVLPREHSAGVAPASPQRNATNHELENLDRETLKRAGASTGSVPHITSNQALRPAR